MIRHQIRRALEIFADRRSLPAPRIQLKVRPCSEPLERRTLLSVVFDPIFGAETQKQGNGDVMRQPPINIIFWGRYWQGGNGTDESQYNSILDTDAENLIIATQKLITSTYFNVTTQYGANPNNMFVNDTAWDSSDTPTDFSTSDLDDAVQNKIENGPFPEPDNQQGLNGEHELPIYLVITQPGVKSSTAEAAGYNIVPDDFYFPDFERTPEIWVSTQIDKSIPNNHVDVDNFTTYLSHEIAEIMTDYNGNGFEVNTPPAWTGGGDDQIGDKEGNDYRYRMPDGLEVQPLWSALDSAWVVTDGTSQIFNLHPNWTNDSFNGNYTLDLVGDQNFSNFDDSVTLGTGSNGGVQVTLNGETFNFDPGYISHVQVDTGLGTNSLTFTGLPNGVSVDAFSTLGTINLLGTAVNTNWAITGPNVVTGNQNSFGDVNNFTTGSDSDQIQIQAGGSISGNLDGGAGSNYLIYDAGITAPVITNASNSTTTGIGGTYANISDFIANGTNAGTTFTAPSGNWSIYGTNDGNLPGVVAFGGYPNLVTGDQNDSFKFDAMASIGSINGGLGNNTFDLSGIGKSILVNLQTQSVAGVVNSFKGITGLSADGTLYANQLIGPDVPSVWSLTGPYSGTVGAVSYSGFDQITGGAAADQFQFKPGGSVQILDGTGGANTLDYSALPGPITVNFQTGAATALIGFSNITNVIGSQSTADTIVGPDASWVINGANSGSVNGITFSSFENLTGSPQTDTFTFLAGGSLSGNLDGGGGTDTLDYSNLTTPISVNPATGKANGIGGTFTRITSIIGGTGGITVTPPNGAVTWTITGVNTVGAFGFTFNNLSSIVGGTGNDTFVFLAGGRLDGKIDGGGGTNTLTYAGFTGNVIVDLPLNLATGVAKGLFNVQNVTGGKGNSLIVGDANRNVLTGGTGRNIIIGGRGGDTLTGGGNDNILIGGSTAWDKNITALQAIFAEWIRTDLSFDQRVAHLSTDRSNGLNGKYDLDWDDVVSDTSRDTLIGTTGNDWFFVTAFQDIIPSGLWFNDRITFLALRYWDGFFR